MPPNSVGRVRKKKRKARGTVRWQLIFATVIKKSRKKKKMHVYTVTNVKIK